MKLRSLTIDKLPGIPKRLEITGFGPAVNFLTGPNASGKTSLIRALGYLLNPPHKSDPKDLIVHADFEIDGERWSVTRAGLEPVWRRGEKITTPPDLPATDVLGCHLIRIEDLVALGQGDESELAEKLQIEMDGGLRLRSLRAGCQKVLNARTSNDRASYLDAREHLREIRQNQRQLATRQAAEPSLIEAIETAKAAQQQLELLGIALELTSEIDKLEKLKSELQALPNALSKMTGTEMEALASFEKKRDEAKAKLDSHEKTINLTQQAIKQTGISDPEPDAAFIKTVADKLDQLSKTHEQIQTNQKAHHLAKERREQAARRLQSNGSDIIKTWPDLSIGAINEAQALARKIDRAHQASLTQSSTETRPAWWNLGLIILGTACALAGVLLDKALLSTLGVTALVLASGTLWLMRGKELSPRSHSHEPGMVQNLEKEAEKLAARLGFDPALLSEQASVSFADAYRQYQTESQTYHELSHRLDHLIECEQTIKEQLHQWLTEREEASGLEKSADTASMSLRVRDWLDRADTSRQQRDLLKMQVSERQYIEKELTQSQQSILSLYHTLGLDTDQKAKLIQWLTLRPRWLEIQASIAKHEAVIENGMRKLSNEPEILDLVRAHELTALQEHHEAQARIASELDDLQQQRGRLTQELEQAFEGNALAEAMMEAEQALGQFEARREEALDAQTSLFWLNRLDEKTRLTSGDRTIDKARTLFMRFTHYQWDLKVDEGIQAIRVNDRAVIPLSHLSTASRMQLLLAIRMARVLQSEERHEPLPLMIDEALTTSDPIRASAIIQNFEEIARDQDRQIIYLAASDYELQLWHHVTNSEPTLIELENDNNDSNTHDKPALQFVVAPEAPSPEGLTAQAYGRLLGVSLPRLGQSYEQIHLFYLLHDQPTLLYQCLSQWRISQLGSFEKWLDQDTRNQFVGADQKMSLRRRCQILKQWWEAWCQGQPIPIDEAVLAQAQDGGGLTDKTLPGVIDMARSVEFDPSLLVDKLENEPILMGKNKRRLRQDQLESLKVHLTDMGYLPTRATLSPEQRRIQALGNLLGEPSKDELSQWHHLIDQLESNVSIRLSDN